jgi:DNA-binding NtrC family response regulator
VLKGKQEPPRRVLLVDDDADIRRLLGVVVEREGLTCDTSSSGEEAILNMEHEVYDLLIADKNLPGMNGIDLARTAHFMYPKMPILLITGFASTSSARDAAALGIADYVTKPLDVTEFRNTIWNLLRRSEGRFRRDAGRRREPASVPAGALRALVARRSSPDLMNTEEGRAAATAMFKGVAVVLIEREDDSRQQITEVVSGLRCALVAYKTSADAKQHIEQYGAEILIANADVLTANKRWLDDLERPPSGTIAIMESSGIDQVREAIRLGARGILFPPFTRSDVYRELLRTMTGLMEERAANVFSS